MAHPHARRGREDKGAEALMNRASCDTIPVRWKEYSLMGKARWPGVLALAVLVYFPLAARSQSAGTPPRPGQGILDVVVVDEEAKPLEGVLVSVPGYHSKTGLSGTCRFGLIPGRYAILVHKEEYRGR